MMKTKQGDQRERSVQVNGLKGAVEPNDSVPAPPEQKPRLLLMGLKR